MPNACLGIVPNREGATCGDCAHLRLAPRPYNRLFLPTSPGPARAAPPESPMTIPSHGGAAHAARGVRERGACDARRCARRFGARRLGPPLLRSAGLGGSACPARRDDVRWHARARMPAPSNVPRVTGECLCRERARTPQKRDEHKYPGQILGKRVDFLQDRGQISRTRGQLFRTARNLAEYGASLAVIGPTPLEGAESSTSVGELPEDEVPVRVPGPCADWSPEVPGGARDCKCMGAESLEQPPTQTEV